MRAALVAAFGADATAKLAPLIAKFDEAVQAAGGVDALAAQATNKLNELVRKQEVEGTVMRGKALFSQTVQRVEKQAEWPAALSCLCVSGNTLLSFLPTLVAVCETGPALVCVHVPCVCRLC